MEQIVSVELQLPSKLHRQMLMICERRRISLNATLLDLIDRFMPPGIREGDLQDDISHLSGRVNQRIDDLRPLFWRTKASPKRR